MGKPSRSVDTLQFVDNLSWQKGPHSVRFGTNMRFQRHTDTRGSVGGANVSPTANFSTAVNTVDIATFGIPAEHSGRERPPRAPVQHQFPARTHGHSHSGVRAAGGHVRSRRHPVRLRVRLSGAGLLCAGHLETAFERDRRSRPSL